MLMSSICWAKSTQTFCCGRRAVCLVARVWCGRCVILTARTPGAPDRRLLVTEPEFARVLSGRRLSSLSPVLREAWDGEDLETLTRNSLLHATDADLALIGYITATELRHCSRTLSIASGLLKSFSLRGVSLHPVVAPAGMRILSGRLG